MTVTIFDAGGGSGTSGGVKQLVSLHTPAMNAATCSQTGITGTYKDLIIKCVGGSIGTATRYPRIQIADATGAGQTVTTCNIHDVSNTTYSSSTSETEPLNTYAFMSAVNLTAAQTFDFEITVHDYATTGMSKRFTGWYKDSSTTTYFRFSGFIHTDSAISVFYMDINSTGSFDAGTVTIYGRM